MYKIATSTVSLPTHHEVQNTLEFSDDETRDEIIERITRNCDDATIQKDDNVAYIVANHNTYIDYILITNIGG